MGILTTPDKEKVKRAVPKQSNKVIDATVARLYVAYPDHTQWTYTGLMGAVALVDDLVGHTFFLKLVDITGARGVLWDQELYVDFQYHQDRTFFHTFELDDCLAGLLFEDTHDAAHFYKRVTSRQKHASKQTANNKNAVALKDRLGPEEVKQGNRGEYVDVTTGQRSRRAKGVLYYDDQPPPEWRSLYSELAAAGISEDMIAENRQFIKDYIAQQGGPLVGLEPPIPRRFGTGAPIRNPSNGSSAAPVMAPKKTKKAPPPPPPASHISSSVASPSPPPSYSVVHEERPASASVSASENEEADSHVETESKPRFRLPPANAPIPPVSHSSASSSQGAPQNTIGQNSQNSQHYNSAPPPSVSSAPPLSMSKTGQRPGPPPPPRAARAVPPPPPRNPAGVGMHTTGSASPPPPPPPPRAIGNAPPPPPSRASRPVPAPNIASQNNYQSPPEVQNSQQFQPPPPPPPQRDYNSGRNSSSAVPAPPPLPPTNSVQVTSMQAAPPPPPLPPVTASHHHSENAPIPPPLPPSNAGAPPPPPPPPPSSALDSQGSAPAAPVPAVDSSRDALLASIRGSGLGMLKKTDKSQLEKPSVLLQEARGDPAAPPSSSSGPGMPGGAGQPETLADALASALNKRKGKVADSDDDDDNEDW